MLVTRVVPGETTTRVERYDATGARRTSIRGIPSGALPVALLDDDAVVATTGSPGTIVVVRGGKAETIVRSDALRDEPPLYLGWLR